MLEFPKRRRIFLMRHAEAAYVSDQGEVTDDPRNVPLTPAGVLQTKDQGDVLADVTWDRIITSNLPRTQETAQRVLAQSHQPKQPAIETEARFEEIRGMQGKRQWPPADGQPVAEVLADIANPWAHGAKPDAQFLGGESFAAFGERVVSAWEDVIQDSSWDTALLVLHGGVNRMIFNHLIGLDWRGDLCIEQDNCCINIIDVDETEPTRYLIRGVNITAYNLSKDGIVLTNMEATAKRVADTLSGL